MTDRPGVLALFHRQFGVASFAQLRALGVSQPTMWRARQRKTIEVVVGDVYRLAGVELSFQGRCMAALLYFGPLAFLCRQTAAAVYGCRDMRRHIVRVTVPATARIGPVPEWIRVHRSSWRYDDDVVTTRDGMRVSSPLRTLFDLAGGVNDYAFGRIAEDFWHLKLLDPTTASGYLDRVRRSGRRGVARFEAWVDRVGVRKRPAQSGLELDVIKAIVDAGLPEPVRQQPLLLSSGELIHIDVAWPEIQFGLEPGHSWWHGGDLKARADMARDNACGELGWFIRRLDESLCDDPAATASLVKALYTSRKATFHHPVV